MTIKLKRVVGLAFICWIGGIMSCNNDAPHLHPEVNLVATINNSDNSSSANGVAIFVYNRYSKQLKYNITYQRIEPSSVQIFSQETKESTPKFEFALPDIDSNPIVGSLQLDDRLHTLLLKGNMSIAFPSADYPEGEIKGAIQIKY